MLKQTDGGPAFPTEEAHKNTYSPGPGRVVYEGMSIRDYFAAQVIGGMLANHTIEIQEEDRPEGWTDAQCLALTAYSIADAMLKEGQK